MARIPFNRPLLLPSAYSYIRQAVENMHLSGDGQFTVACHTLLERTLGVAKALLTTSCTHALEMAALLLDVAPGDEVIVPSFTFVSTINAFVLRGARPVFADIRPDTLNLDERSLDGLLTARTRVIVPVHYAGVGCEMDVICRVASEKNIAIVEDNAHGLFAKYRGKYLGTFGSLATQSFHETKNFACGEGGALIINDERYAERAEILREKGTNRKQFFRGLIDKYTWVDLGSSYLPSDVLAALLLAQLEFREEIQHRRARIWNDYAQELRDWARNRGIEMPAIPDHCEQAYHMFYLVLPSLAERDALISHLRDRGVNAVFHYLPLHLSPMGKTFGGRPGDCPIAEAISDRLIRLPFYYDLTKSDQAKVIDAVRDFHVPVYFRPAV
ncbi:dTDP-4-amino-4,6-dideoxygalactose transaminase [Planctomycetaceae bacterium SCGC AG-212-D15]|nr:dTDP-4-amino-4,6-dideoxygalactose transaminase [Planctomycetaceae bacterium SCGC AG-212-D15]